MKQPIIKLCFPIVYASLLLPIRWTIVFTILLSDVVHNLYGLSDWWVETASLVFLLLIFWLANKVLTKLENLTRPTVRDHYRQSVLLYAIILYNVSGLLSWVTTTVAFLLIIINAVYIYRRCRATLVVPSPLVSPAGVKSPPTKIGLSIFIGPAFIFLLMIIGFYVRQMHYRIQYLQMNPLPRVASPNDPLPPADLQSMTDKLPTSTMINPHGLPLPSDFDYPRR